MRLLVVLVLCLLYWQASEDRRLDRLAARRYARLRQQPRLYTADELEAEVFSNGR